ncbi:Imm26 family immunity protein [Alteromonas lipotrueae]|uniref:Imm26 family immunity protein n=1 Tax=Alteromonas lipotrueae TaxID=2803814 RepID=UPI001C48182D|nr:Imm26 family immunity protein [Alteromonas lipotrueae]
MAKSLNYSEGDCISIPLREGGYARGVVVRMNGSGIIFGYFFGPLVVNESDLAVDETLVPGREILRGQFGDLGLLENEWKVIGRLGGFDRKEWSMPKFLRWEEGEATGVLCTYDENSLEPILEDVITIDDIDTKSYPVDRLMGYGSVEIRLTKLLAPK